MSHLHSHLTSVTCDMCSISTFCSNCINIIVDALLCGVLSIISVNIITHPGTSEHLFLFFLIILLNILLNDINKLFSKTKYKMIHL